MASDCIPWDGRLDVLGYGVRVGGKMAHRFAWEQEHGPIPRGLTIHHECRMRRCVNTEHMTLLTQSKHSRLHGMEPARLKALALKTGRTHCKHGHEFTPENTYLRSDGARACRKCTAANQRRYQRRKRFELWI